MNEKTARKLLKIFAGGKAANEAYELVDGKYILIENTKQVSPRNKEKEEMRRVKEELSQINN
jgi:hypothetical protein